MATELDYQRTNTTAFIEANPTVVTLTPQTKTKTPAGGYKLEDGTIRAAQTMRIIELGTVTTPQVLTLTDGKQREAEFWLLGEHDALVEKGDYWVAADGRRWEVGDIIRSNGYETRALVAERGE